MAGKIVADTLEHSTAGSIATNYVVEGSAKAWASFDQHSTDHPVYSDSSLNTSSTADIAAGVTKITFTNGFSNATYSISGCTQSLNTGGTIFTVWGYATTSSRQMTTSDFHTDFRNSSGANTDSDYTAYQVVGNLA